MAGEKDREANRLTGRVGRYAKVGTSVGGIAAKLAGGMAMADIEGAAEWTSPAGTTMTAKFLAPVPITADNLDVVVDAGWITKEELCQGVSGGPSPCN